jgi:hypothetical protein
MPPFQILPLKITKRAGHQPALIFLDFPNFTAPYQLFPKFFSKIYQLILPAFPEIFSKIYQLAG